jgi:hypothetical protein
MAEVEAALIAHLQKDVLSEGVLDMVLGDIRTELAAQVPKRPARSPKSDPRGRIVDRTVTVGELFQPLKTHGSRRRC